MKRYLALFSYLLFFQSCTDIEKKEVHFIDVDRIFVDWNKLTLLSLDNHMQTAKDSTEKEIYDNRLFAFKAFVQITSFTDIQPNSIRYQFLREFLKEENHKEDFYIIEANRSGESAEMRNYVVFLNNHKID